MENKRIEDLINHSISYREVEGKKTIVLTECELPKVKSLFQSLGKKCLETSFSNSEEDEI